MIKHFAIVVSVIALSVSSAIAGERHSTFIDRALQQAADDQTIFAEFLLGSASVREISAQRALLGRIDEWLASNFGLARATEYPKVAYAEASKIAAVRYSGLTIVSSEVTGSMPRAAPQQMTVAAYVDAEKTVYLPDEWSGRSPAELSVLVHEMVHHMQNLGAIQYECPQQREKLAYAAQDRFLKLLGRDLEGEFEVNPFTVLVRSTCAH
jgi:hypothetical protein